MIFTKMTIALIICLVYIISLLIIFYSKKNAKNDETKIYGVLLIINFLELALHLTSEFVCYHFDSLPYIFSFIVLKCMLIGYYLFGVFLLLYLIILIKYKHKNIIVNCILVFSMLVSCSFFFMPLNVYRDNVTMHYYTYGFDINVTYFLSGIIVSLMILLLLINIRKIHKKKVIPLFIFFIGCGISVTIQRLYPYITITDLIESIICCLMYFTIENPDVKMLNEVEVAREQAEKANRAKTDFLSSMSHEIRTPLNAIVGFSDEIMDAKTIDEAKENAKDIVNASQTLLEIVNGILDISKIEAGKIEIVNSPYNSHEVFEELATLITPKMKEKGLDFTYKIAPDIPNTLYGDHANLKKIITNLLSNACKYTDHGFVHYEVNCVNDRKYSKLIITVEDSGRGIKKENVDKLFNKFQRIDEDRNTTIEGTGLGLAITKQLVELMGGQIIVHTIYGEGSKFTVIVNQRIEEEKIIEKHRVLDTLNLNNIKILLVDDNSLNIKVANKILEKYNANMITSVSSGFECLDKIKSGEKYDVILLDDMMPKMSGVETLKELRNIPGFNTPVVALTANAITGMREKYLSEGFNDYLAKPIEKEQLIRVMNEILGRNITNQIPVNNIKDEVVDKNELSEKNKILQVSEDDIDLIKNQQLISETTKIKIVDKDLDKVVSDDTTEVLDEKKVDNVVDVPTDLLETNNNEEVIPMPDVVEPPSIDAKEYLKGKGVDVEAALENLGDMDMYNDTVKDYLSEVEEKWQRIEDYKLQGNMSDYAVEVHSLKSDSRYLGLNKLADLAYQHELASKENNVDFVNSNFNSLEEEYQRSLDIIKNYQDTYLK